VAIGGGDIAPAPPGAGLGGAIMPAGAGMGGFVALMVPAAPMMGETDVTPGSPQPATIDKRTLPLATINALVIVMFYNTLTFKTLGTDSVRCRRYAAHLASAVAKHSNRRP
jgi:hypothetical protein